MKRSFVNSTCYSNDSATITIVMAVLEAEFVGSLGGRVALVTGASRGLGKGIARMLCEAGATVYITGLSNSQV